MGQIQMQMQMRSVAPPVRLSEVRAVQFSVADPEQTRRQAVVDVGESGLADHRLGPPTEKHLCATCHGTALQCPGHWGYLELYAPVYHFAFLGHVCSVLKCVDQDTGALDLAPGKAAQPWVEADPPRPVDLQCLDRPASTRLAYAQKHARNAAGFRVVNAKIVFAQKADLSPTRALDILSRISTRDAEVLGFVGWHPKHLVLTVLPIPPPQIRPSVLLNGDKADDDLTKSLGNIIKANNRLRDAHRQGTKQGRVDELHLELQVNVTTFVDNEKKGVQIAQQRTGRPLQSMSQRLKGKEGRMRNNLQGKRTDWSARTVISGDPTLPLGDIGVPRSVANTLTMPESVTPRNIARLQALVASRTARYVKSGGAAGRLIDLRFATPQLQPGDIVERPLADGDFIVFNRQPSLHKMSMMAHRVRVLPFSTFRMNLSATAPYNADFDGDEMNCFLPQTVEAQAEIRTLLPVSKNIISPQTYRPVMGIVQDSLVGSYILTRRDTFLDRTEVSQLLMALPAPPEMPAPTILAPTELWTGKQIFSLLLPTLDFQRRSSWIIDDAEPFNSPSDGQVVIQGGQLLAGTLCKKSLGTSKGGLVHRAFDAFGHQEAADMMDRIQAISVEFLAFRGFSVGIGDALVAPGVEAHIQTLLQQARSLQGTEEVVAQGIEAAKHAVGAAVGSALAQTNRFTWMEASGAKGAKHNIHQIIGCVGQQNIEGQRVPAMYGAGRTLPHYPFGIPSTEACGFVSGSYAKGLSPQEVFFHALGGREGLIDTAIKTRDSGYTQRRLSKTLESLVVAYDNTVRAGEGQIVQFLYGEDGTDGLGNPVSPGEPVGTLAAQSVASSITQSTLNSFARHTAILLELDGLLHRTTIGDFVDARIEEALHVEHHANDTLLAWLPGTNIRIPSCDELGRITFCRVEAVTRHPVINEDGTDTMLDVRLQSGRSVVATKGLSFLTRQGNKILPLKGSHLRVGDYLPVAKPLDALEITPDEIPGIFTRELGKVRVRRAHLPELRARLGLAEDRAAVDRAALEDIFYDKVISINEVANGHPWAYDLTVEGTRNFNTFCGIAVRDSFHHAGTSNSDVLLGCPRLTELINASAAISTPILTMKAADRAAAADIEASIVARKLQDVLHSATVHYDPGHMLAREQLELWYEMPDAPPESLSDWVLRLELLHSTLVAARLQVADVADLLTRTWPPAICCCSEENDDPAFVHVRVPHGKWDHDAFLRAAAQAPSILLSGIDGITAAYVTQEADGCKVTTDGSRFLAAMGAPGVNFATTLTNHIIEVRQVLGIEAARRRLIEEIQMVFEIECNFVSPRHLMLLVDTMTQFGNVASVTRTGVIKAITGVFGVASFEETVDVLFRAGLNRSVDHLRGVSQKVIFGQSGNFGSGMADLLLDVDGLPDDPDPPKPRPAPRSQPGPAVSAAAGPPGAMPARSALWAPSSPLCRPPPWTPSSPLRF